MSKNPKPLPSLRWRANKQIVGTFPIIGSQGQLRDLPLTKDDWRMVYFAYQAFRVQIRLIADMVIERERAGGEQTQ